MTTLAEAHALVAEQATATLRRLAWLQRRSLCEPEDLEQDLWLILAALLARHDPARGPLDHYLRACVPWQLRRALQRWTPARHSGAAGARVVPYGPGFWEVLAEEWGGPDEDATTLREALAGLPPEERAVVVWHALEGLGFREIAARLGRPRATIWGVWQRAARWLRAYYADERREHA